MPITTSKKSLGDNCSEALKWLTNEIISCQIFSDFNQKRCRGSKLSVRFTNFFRLKRVEQLLCLSMSAGAMAGIDFIKLNPNNCLKENNVAKAFTLMADYVTYYKGPVHCEFLSTEKPVTSVIYQEQLGEIMAKFAQKSPQNEEKWTGAFIRQREAICLGKINFY